MVSVIIPVFNRAPLIAQTLNSIRGQSYKGWECIVVDDGSIDETNVVINACQNKDSRIRHYRRPDNFPKGANSCRNYGFRKSIGSYIIWFDSDDLMTPDHIEKKVKALQSSGADYVVARTANFQNNKLLEPYKYEKKSYGIKAADFILSKIHWYTYDVLLKREVAEKIEWNEKMKSWQDYNYFCKMLLVTENGTYLDEVLTHRRLHSNSIQSALTKDKVTFKQELLENTIYTFRDIYEKINAETKIELIFGMMNLCYELGKLRSFSGKMNHVKVIIRRNLGMKSLLLFQASIVSAWLFKRGFFLLEKAKKR